MLAEVSAPAAYRIEWRYTKELARFPQEDEAHCSFLIRLLDEPPGSGHCAFFCVNVITRAKAAALGLGSTPHHAYVVADAMTESEFRERITRDVDAAFASASRDDALRGLNARYVWENVDHRAEFAADAPSAPELAGLIERAFSGVTRDGGITLREALAEDDYAGPEAKAAARAQDVDTDWHDVPRDVLIARCEFFSYLDAAGYRYYLPAAMMLAFDEEGARSDTLQRAYWSLLPLVAPRDFGKGSGAAFDVDAFIAERRFDDAQVRAIYAFLCFMANEGDEGVDEEQLPAFEKWRANAARRRLTE